MYYWCLPLFMYVVGVSIFRSKPAVFFFQVTPAKTSATSKLSRCRRAISSRRTPTSCRWQMTGGGLALCWLRGLSSPDVLSGVISHFRCSRIMKISPRIRNQIRRNPGRIKVQNLKDKRALDIRVTLLVPAYITHSPKVSLLLAYRFRDGMYSIAA